MGAAISVAVVLTEIHCGECGGTYAINERYRKQRQEKSGFWMCPYCRCEWGYPKDGSENEKLRRELEAERQRKARALEEANRLRAEAEKATKQRDRLKRRVANGVCPCCTRTFVNLGRHMATKHPEFTAERVA